MKVYVLFKVVDDIQEIVDIFQTEDAAWARAKEVQASYRHYSVRVVIWELS